MTFIKFCGMKAAYNCYKGGMSVKEIAKQAKKSTSTIYKWMKIFKYS